MKMVSDEYYSSDAANWYRAHFGDCPSHAWSPFAGSDNMFFTSIFGLRWGSVGSNVRDTLELVGHLNDDDKQRLDKLFLQDEEECKKAFSELCAP
jgi:hypothetical protein